MGESVDEGKINSLVKNLKMVNSNFALTKEIAEGNHPWNIETRKVIVDELQKQWNE